MKYVLFYESADDVAAKAPAHFAAHTARFAEFEGTLLGVVAQGDPFVLNGVVRRWEVREWNDVLEGS